MPQTIPLIALATVFIGLGIWGCRFDPTASVPSGPDAARSDSQASDAWTDSGSNPPEAGFGEILCNDAIDNDGNGKTDCDDPSCEGRECGDNGLTCSQGACSCPAGSQESVCTNGRDDDCDGMTDCLDPDCEGAECAAGMTCQGGQCICEGGTLEVDCFDGRDNDCDGLLDCQDPDCVAPLNCVDWVFIEGGPFNMGSDTMEADADEEPVHEVDVPGFHITKTEVTVAQYEHCVDAGGCSLPDTSLTTCNWDSPGRLSHPVNCVAWDQAVAFCRWAGGRLPSEAEWEYAARSQGEDRTFPWGEAPPTCSLVVMWDTGDYGCGTGHTLPVCSRTSGNTEQGLCDMSGNVFEWVQDYYYGNYDSAPTDGTAQETPPGGDNYRVARGGSFRDGFPHNLRTTFRNRGGRPGTPTDTPDTLGFRCAK